MSKKPSYVATEEFEFYDENNVDRVYKVGDPVHESVVHEMWSEGGGTSNPRLQLPVRKVK